VLIDWFTVVAQIVNFLVLVGLLKYFLFDRITKAMDEREHTIASALEQADEARKLAQEEAERYRHMNEELEEGRQRTLAEAKDEADSLRKALLQSARAEVAEAKIAWEESLDREKDVFLVDLRRRIGEQALSIAGFALSDLANSDLEARIVHVFVDRFGNLSAEHVAAIRDVLQTADPEITIQTAFDVSERHRNEILESLHNRLNEDLHVRFEKSAGIVCGIEMRFHGHKLAWSIDSYLDGLEKSISSTLEERVWQLTQTQSVVQNKSLDQGNEPKTPQGEQTSETRSRGVDVMRGGK
jgi:F-type H+-transporting ATPase subunit b